MPRRRLPIAALALVALAAGGCTTRNDRAYRDWERRHPQWAAAADGAEIVAYVVLDVAAKAAALALSR
jgi:hypothetical protein